MSLRWRIVLVALAVAAAAAAPRPAAALTVRDQQVKQAVLLLRGYIDRQGAANGFVYPAKDQVRMGAGLTAPVWPLNPYTGKPIEPGSARGAFTYTVAVDRHSYTLVGHLSASSYRLTGGSPAWLAKERAKAASDLVEVQGRLTDAESALVATREQLVQTEARLIDAQSELIDKQAELDAIKSQLSDAQADLVTAESERDAALADLAVVQGELAEAHGELTAAQEQLSDARDQAVRHGLHMVDEFVVAAARAAGKLPLSTTVSGSGDDWPVNPYDGQAMHQGTGLGDFQYDPHVDGSFTLTATTSGTACVISGPAADYGAGKDYLTIQGATFISYGLELQAFTYNDTYPEQLSFQDSSMWVDPWPKNPFTGQFMDDSPAKGDYAYSVVGSGEDYQLVANLSDGSTYDVGALWTKPLFGPLHGFRQRLKDLIAQSDVQVIKDYVEAWKLTHSGVLPTVDELSSTGAVGSAHTWWPKSPWTGMPMTSGDARGDFQYVPSGGSYTLAVREAPFLDPLYGGAFPEYYQAQ